MVSSKAITLMGFLCIALLLASTEVGSAINLPTKCISYCYDHDGFNCNAICIGRGYKNGGKCTYQFKGDYAQCCCFHN
ncbi:hypothetical protein G4B88_024566 [Cannabis sativa]|uniref:Uncharacterized protein n=1 Tax=Cannabis sativa TaxID=3483 RepID=A0A7J6GVN8_CANSA|nr:hypothetical protein G4B88_024566 [Cannabis sativa]